MSIKYEERLVAFVDILGFKELVYDSVKSDAVMDKIYEAMQTILDVKKVEGSLSNLEIGRTYQATVTTFSDSIIISYLLGSYGNLFRILLDIIHLQLALAYQGILIRGGIAIGKAYHDGEIVFGPAMNEAYELESLCAKYPRIIVKQDTLIDGIKLTCAKHHTEAEEAEFPD